MSPNQIKPLLVFLILGAYSATSLAQGEGELLRETSPAKKFLDKVDSLKDGLDEKFVAPISRAKDRFDCSMDRGPNGCTTLTGEQKLLSPEELRERKNAAEKYHRQRERERWQITETKLTPEERLLLTLPSDSPWNTPDVRPTAPANQPPAGSGSFATSRVLDGAAFACRTAVSEERCHNFYRISATTYGLNQEPPDYMQAAKFCEGPDQLRKYAAIDECKKFYQARFGGNPSPSGSTLEAMMREQQTQEMTAEESARQVTLRRQQQWDADAARQRQVQQIEQEKYKASLDAPPAERSSGEANPALMNALIGIIGAAAGRSNSGGARGSGTTTAPTYSTECSGPKAPAYCWTKRPVAPSTGSSTCTGGYDQCGR